MLNYIIGVTVAIIYFAICAWMGYRKEEDLHLGIVVGWIIGLVVGLPIQGLIIEVTGGNISEGVVYGILAVYGVVLVGFLLEQLAFRLDDKLYYCNWFLPVAQGVIVTGMLVILVVGGVHCYRRDQRVLLPEPKVVETRYDLLGGSDSSRVSGYVTGNLYRIRGEVGESDCFKIYHEEKRDGEYIAVPMLIPEDVTTVVLMKEPGEEYVLQIDRIFYREDRNVEPYEVTVDHVESSYKLYVNEATFTGLKLDGD